MTGAGPGPEGVPAQGRDFAEFGVCLAAAADQVEPRADALGRFGEFLAGPVFPGHGARDKRADRAEAGDGLTPDRGTKPAGGEVTRPVRQKNADLGRPAGHLPRRRNGADLLWAL